MEHAEAKAVVQEQVEEWLSLFDDDMNPKPGAVIPPQVHKWKETHEREKKVAAWLARWGPPMGAAGAVAVCAVMYQYIVLWWVAKS